MWRASLLPAPRTAAPDGLTAPAVSDSHMELVWTDSSSNAVRFTIERKMNASGNFSQIATVYANVTAYSDPGLSDGTPCVYRVRASSSSGHSDYSAAANATTLQVTCLLTVAPVPMHGLVTASGISCGSGGTGDYTGTYVRGGFACERMWRFSEG